jgi:hypothetical protein
VATYWTNIGPTRGPWLHKDAELVGAIGVLRAPGDHNPIGMALGAGISDDGVALWRLTVRGAELPGLFVVIDRPFWPAGSE